MVWNPGISFWKEILYYLGYPWEGWEGSPSLDISDVPSTASFTGKATNSRRSLFLLEMIPCNQWFVTCTSIEQIQTDYTKTHAYMAFADCFIHCCPCSLTPLWCRSSPGTPGRTAKASVGSLRFLSAFEGRPLRTAWKGKTRNVEEQKCLKCLYTPISSNVYNQCIYLTCKTPKMIVIPAQD